MSSLRSRVAVERGDAASYLVRAPLFADLTTAELAELARITRPRNYLADEVIFYKDDPGTGLFIVTRGTVKISIGADDGQETLLALMGPGQCFGELAVLDGYPRSATATALEPSETLFLFRDDFLAFLDHHPPIMRKIVVMLSKRLRDTDEHLGDLVFHDVYSRLAKKLLELAVSHGRGTASGVQIALPLTQQELANLVGASRESVNKAIKYFRDRGSISMQSQRITVLKPEDLQTRASR